MSPRCIVFFVSAAIWAGAILAACQSHQPPGQDLWLAVCAEQGTC